MHYVSVCSLCVRFIYAYESLNYVSASSGRTHEVAIIIRGKRAVRIRSALDNGHDTTERRNEHFAMNRGFLVSSVCV